MKHPYPVRTWACLLLALLALPFSALADAAESAQPTLPPVQESFVQLKQDMPDLCGWLEMDLGISLPVMLRDNSFYLSHDVNGASSKAGALFLDARNELYPADQHQIIYGHNMRDNTIFGSLDRYRELDTLRQYPLLSFDTLYENVTYVPVAMFDASMNQSNSSFFHILRFNFDEEQPVSKFIDGILRRSMYNIPVDVNETDQFLTLCTCSYTLDNGRFLLVYRRLREGETPEAMAELVQQSTWK